MGVKILIIRLIKLVLELFIKPVVTFAYKIYYRESDRTHVLPGCKSPLIFLPAHKLAEKIRNKEISSLEIVETYINRIKQVQPFVNCVVKTCYDEAIEQAKFVDKLLEEQSLPDKYSLENAPLLGVPFSCKESLWVKGMPNSTGVRLRKDFRAPDDADVVRYMKQAGAIMTCLTNTSEVCMWLESSNYLYGTTRNPYNLSRIVGGSSGGEGCIVSSTGAVIGIGSDIGGSIRMPAFFNGIYGHKPTSNFISNNVQYPPSSGMQAQMLGTGPLCRYASDLKLMFKIFAGPRFSEVANKFATPINFKQMKYYFISDMQNNLFVSNQSADTKSAMKKAISFVENSFDVKLVELKPSKLQVGFEMWSAMMRNGKETTEEFTKLLGDNRVAVNPYMELLKSLTFLQNKHTLPAIALAIIERIPLVKPKHFVELADQLRDEIKSALGDDGILLFPSFPVVAPFHNQPLITNTFDFIHYGIMNCLGFPTTQCPMGLNSEGLPTGVQVVANHGSDHLTIGLAEYFEQNLVGWVAPF